MVDSASSVVTKFTFQLSVDNRDMLEASLIEAKNNKNVFSINGAEAVSTPSSVLNGILADYRAVISESCPLLSEATWIALLYAFRTRENCRNGEAIPVNFGEGIRSREDLLVPLRRQLGIDDGIAHQELESKTSNTVYKVTFRELATLRDNWLTVRAVVHVLEMADYLRNHAPDRWRGGSPYAVAAAYYRGGNRLAIIE